MRAAHETLGVELSIELLRRRPGAAVARDPCVAVALVIGAAAEGARSMAGGERHRLVVEEEQRVPARSPLRQPLVLVFEGADDPQRTAVEAHDLGAVMEVPPVAGPRASERASGCW